MPGDPAEDLLAFRSPGAPAEGSGNSVSSANGVSSAVEKLLSAREDQRIVIVLSKMDTVRWRTPATGLSDTQMAAVDSIRELINQSPTGMSAEKDRRAAHEAYGRRSRDLLRGLLSPTHFREQALRRHLTTRSHSMVPYR